MAGKRKPPGYWTKENTIKEAKLVFEEFGSIAISQSWLNKNGRSDLTNAIREHGGFVWIRQELGLEEGRRANGYWTKENTIKEAREVLEEFGEEAINKTWLYENGRSDLANAINNHGGFAWIRQELGLTETCKPRGYWDKENTIKEAKLVLEEFGSVAISQSWLKKNGRGDLAAAISKHGGLAWIRKELGLAESRRASGYWTKENTIKEAREVLEEFGEEVINQSWLYRNGRSDLAGAISKHGGFAWIRKELGLTEICKPRGYWTRENTIKEAREILEEFGEEAINKAWLDKNGRSGLTTAINNHGGFAWIREELGLEEGRRASGYWTRENTIKEAREVLEELGEEAINQAWLKKNGRGDLANAINKNGGFAWIRKELGLNPDPHNIFNRIPRRTLNLQQLKQWLRDLQAEGVHHLTPAQMVILLQQGGFDKASLEDGKGLFKQVTEGSLLPRDLLGWSQGEEEEPTASNGSTEEPSISKPVDGSETPAPGDQPTDGTTNPSDPDMPIDGGGDIPQPSPGGDSDEPADQPDDSLPAITLEDPEEQLKLLDCEVFAAADDEAIEALTSIALHRLWEQAYLNQAAEQRTVEACQQHDAKRPWTSRIQAEFLRQYAGARGIQLPPTYRFTVKGVPTPPRLMQLHVAFLAKEQRRLLVLSDMGTGKSLAAQVAVMNDNAKRILVLPINSCRHQWADEFRNNWAGVKVWHDLGRDADKRLITPDLSTSNGSHVWVLPIHLLSLMDDRDALDLVEQFQPDAVILDEVQYLKQRHEAQETARRELAAKVLALSTEMEPDAMVLALSGTAVVNNLTEARKLIELVQCEERPDLPTAVNPANAMRMHQALMAMGIRQRANGQFPVTTHRPEVDASAWIEEVRLVKRYPARDQPRRLERILLEAKIPAVIEAIDGPSIVAVQCVDGFIEPLRQAITEAGYSVGVHTGKEKLPVHGHDDAIKAFRAGAVDVLLASIETMGTGVDHLQDVSHNMVIASLPWTAASYNQLIARLARSGQSETVKVTIPTTFIDYIDREEGPSRWSFCDYRAACLQAKQRLMDAVMDGLLPDTDGISEGMTAKRLGQWIDRLDGAGAFVRYSRPITVPLVFTSEVEEVKARRRYGDFSSCNGRWNAVPSDKLHARLQRNPQDWELYHTDLKALRENWTVDPLQEAIKFLSQFQGLTIGDFGCGTAELAKALGDQHTVHSFDHIAINDSVIACDIAAGVPLDDNCLDYAVFSLSLMGTNWADQLAEAQRCLKPTGQLLVWTAEKGKDPDSYQQRIESEGFKTIASQRHDRWLHIWAAKAPKAVASTIR